MEYTRAYVRSITRDLSLTIDHDLSMEASLASLSPLQIPQISPIEFQELSIHKDPKIPQAAVIYLQELCYTPARLTSINWQLPATKTLDSFHSDDPMTPARESKQSSISGSPEVQPSFVTNMCQKTQDSNPIGTSSKHQCLPGSTKDNPYVIEPFEDQFSRISVTPDIEIIPKKWSKKINSLLTPPNTVRTHRKLSETILKKAVIPNDTPTALGMRSTSSSRHSKRQILGPQRASHISRNRTEPEQPKPRKTLRKIELDKVPQTLAQTSVSAYTDVKQHIENVLKNHKLATLDIRALSWSPWTPYHFDEAAFRGRFDVWVGEGAGNSLKIPQPINPRSLLNFVGVEEENFEPLEPIKLTNAWDSLSLTKKRKLNSIYDALNQGDRPCKIPTKTQASEKFENSFPERAFGLLADRFIQLTRTDTPNDVTPVSVSTLSHKKRCDVSRTLLPPNKSYQDTVSFPPGNYQIIATSCSLAVRQAIRYIDRTLDKIEVVERDFLASWTSVEGIPGDADIILSSEVGVLLTTIEEVQQHPLPGTTSLPRFYRKLLSLVPKFQTIHVLVNSKSGGNEATILKVRALIEKDERLSTARIHIQAFDEHQGIERMYLRIAELVVQNLRPMPTDLQEEETGSECYLRKKIGINAFATQVVLQRLRASGLLNDEHPSLMLTNLKKKTCLRDLQTILDKKSSQLLALRLSRLERPKESDFQR